MNWIKKNGGILLSILLITITIAVFGPLELYLTNSDEFWFSFTDILTVVAILSAVCFTVLLLITCVLRGQVRAIWGAGLFALGIALYIQGNYANINYGTLDGTAIDWGAYPLYGVLDTLGWFAVFVAILVLFFKKKEWFIAVQKYGSLFIIAIQVITLGVLLIMSDATAEKSSYYLSEKGMYEVSANENIIIFVLDAFDDAYWQEIYNEDFEKYNEVFEDFTYFGNATVAAARTKAALSAIITGEPYPGKISYAEYIEDFFDKDGLYTELNKQNFNVGIYTNSIFIPENVENLIHNQEASGYKVTSYVGMSEKFSDLMLYEHMPHFLKSFFWIYSGDFEQYKTGSTVASYITDDVKFYENLKLTINEDKNVYRLYHLNGSHSPYWLNEFAEKQEEATDVVKQSKGAMYIVEDYINQLKELNVYDNSTIIIISDHGDINSEYNIVNDAHGILFVKQKNNTHSFITNSTPVSYFELHSTIFSELGIDKGKTFFSITEGDNQIRYFYRYATEGGHFVVDEYIVDGDIKNIPLQTTGRRFEPIIDITNYKYGTQLTFGASGSAIPYVVSGLSGTDAGDYSWTDGKQCIFEIPLAEKTKNNLKMHLSLSSIYTANGAQKINIYVNDILCHETVLSKTRDIQFIIDNKLLNNDGKLTLRFDLPNAVSPFALFGGANDSRILSLALRGLCISETKESPTNDFRELALNQNISFLSDNKEVINYYQYGFSSPENNFTWTDGYYASFVGKLDSKSENDLNCTIQLSTIYGDKQTVKITSKGQELYNDVLTKDDKEISFTVPNECITDGIVSLQFELPNAACPKELGTGEDARTLAIAVNGIVFSEITK